uniref:ATP synthase F0 subunit 8 n=1 Tax=Pleurobema oviforme TaxID=293128 RepID=A0A7D5Y0H8_9BIVA|nr:ATP synthase F0 subunit 8 [Pleurobema oviforme]QLJ92880.1 ATP synthase F0 subunit 8 [Pleurobema oviforme]
MPQLSPMSWVLVFGILLICVVLFMVSVWWSAGGEYGIVYGLKSGKVVGHVVDSVKWGFNSKLGFGGSKK